MCQIDELVPNERKDFEIYLFANYSFYICVVKKEKENLFFLFAIILTDKQ